MQYDFPAVFYPDDNSVAFHFYDREDWFSCGSDIADAIEIAEDVILLPNSESKNPIAAHHQNLRVYLNIHSHVIIILATVVLRDVHRWFFGRVLELEII